ncbi:hypothetical protein K505DRAFT_388035 [Melanomma pulvis-pyrius CBS 109.77]|uniref:Uncharacterized protein n=1 Tax=Melanomma pulvis-pyrius CBS 109.77 TaxID=1314802 RepID=A0A6A6X7N8_9PLEO|nr:hypothetical protein K505DRAFT_388035 [Melanomma pulvis-pyrius CBS 109.77]
MAVPFIPHCSLVATQDRLQYLLQLQNESEKRTRDHVPEEQSVSLPSTIISGELAVLSPVPSITGSHQDRLLDQAQATQPKPSILGALRRLQHSKSTEELRSAKGARVSIKRRLRRETQLQDKQGTEKVGLEALRRFEGHFEGWVKGGDGTGVYRFEGGKARSSERAFRKAVSNDGQPETPDFQLFPTVIWPCSENLRRTRHGSTNYPATTLFRRCSKLFTNPFAPEFSLDPTKLAFPSALLSCDLCMQQTTTKSCPPRSISILDVGGDFAANRHSFQTAILRPSPECLKYAYQKP